MKYSRGIFPGMARNCSSLSAYLGKKVKEVDTNNIVEMAL